MQLPKELLHPLAGLRLLAKGDARGLSNFDISDDGIIRSFRAFLFCLPVFCFRHFRRIESNVSPILVARTPSSSFRLLVVAASNWASLYLPDLGRISARHSATHPTIMVILNWSAVPVLYASGLFIIPFTRRPPVLDAEYVILDCSNRSAPFHHHGVYFYRSRWIQRGSVRHLCFWFSCAYLDIPLPRKSLRLNIPYP